MVSMQNRSQNGQQQQAPPLDTHTHTHKNPEKARDLMRILMQINVKTLIRCAARSFLHI